MSWITTGSRRDPFREDRQIREMILGCMSGKRVLFVVTSLAKRNHVTARMIRLAGLYEVHRWRKDGLLTFKIV